MNEMQPHRNRTDEILEIVSSYSEDHPIPRPLLEQTAFTMAAQHESFVDFSGAKGREQFYHSLAHLRQNGYVEIASNPNGFFITTLGQVRLELVNESIELVDG